MFQLHLNRSETICFIKMHLEISIANIQLFGADQEQLERMEVRMLKSVRQ